jgi:D-serine deaminase-like pyridoxal phosphate-dependent protein
MRVDDIDTPAPVIDLGIMDSNIGRLQAYLDQHGIGNRPHIKTHKIPAIAHLQLAAGAIGITCQKLGEAEVMAAAGIRDILLTYNVIGRPKLERLVRLARRTQLIVALDNLTAARGIAEAVQDAGLTVDVLVEFGTELERTGVPTPAGLVELARQVDDLPGLRLRGLMVYPSHPANAGRIEEAVESMQAAGLPTDIVSGGGTPAAMEAHRVPYITEHRAGTYVFNDTLTIGRGAATLDDCALTIVTTVVSRPTAERAILDAGSKTFSSDGGPPVGHVVDFPNARIYKMNEEHGYVDIAQCESEPEIGDRLRVIPNHACGTMNMHDVAYGVRGEYVEVIWDVAARGKVR